MNPDAYFQKHPLLAPPESPRGQLLALSLVLLKSGWSIRDTKSDKPWRHYDRRKGTLHSLEEALGIELKRRERRAAKEERRQHA